MMKRTIFMVSLLLLLVPFAFAANHNQTTGRENMTVSINAPPSFVTGPTLEDSDIAVANQLDPVPGTTFKVWCNGTANDSNGYADLASASGVIYGPGSSAGAADDPTNHYSAADCNLSLNTDGKFSCAFDVQFYALNGTWTCDVNVTDSVGQSTLANDTSDMTQLLAINVPSATMDFGTMLVGTDTGATDKKVNVTNNGNVRVDLQLDAYKNWAAPDNNDVDAMGCSILGSIPIANVRYSLTPATNYAAKTSFQGAGVLTENTFKLAPQTSGVAGTTKPVYFGLGIPAAGVAGTCNGVLEFTGIQG